MTEALFDIDAPDTVKAHACTGRLCGVCHAEARAAADSGIAQAKTNADPQWLEMAERYMRAEARVCAVFTTDDVMIWLARNGFTTHDARALGSVVRRLRREGVIVPVDWVPSVRRHGAPIPLYLGVRHD